MLSCPFVHWLAPKLKWSTDRTNCSYYSSRVDLYSHQILFHRTLNGVNLSSFLEICVLQCLDPTGAKFDKFLAHDGPWASPYAVNGKMTMVLHNFRCRQFHRTSNKENPSSGFRDMSSTKSGGCPPGVHWMATFHQFIMYQLNLTNSFRGMKYKHMH